MTIFTELMNDENGFIISAELVVVGTVAVLGVMVGLAEVTFNVNQELEDVGSAFTCLDQSYEICQPSGWKGYVNDSSYEDTSEDGDWDGDIVCGN